MSYKIFLGLALVMHNEAYRADRETTAISINMVDACNNLGNEQAKVLQRINCSWKGGNYKGRVWRDICTP